jgi:DNA-binding GntR family transcriptional regulator
MCLTKSLAGSSSESLAPGTRKEAASPSELPSVLMAETDPAADRATQAYTRLRGLIVRGRLAPGSRIVESELARRLGVSRTPVRAALQRLHQEGYIVLDRTGGTGRPMVAPLTREDAWELLHLVGELEGFAARGAAHLAREEREALVAELRRRNEVLRSAATAAKRNANAIFEADDAFHAAFVEAGAGPRLKALHRSIKPQTERYIRVYIGALVDEIHRSVQEHEAVIAGLEAGDPDAAQRAVQANWRRAAASLCQVIGVVGERGTW